MLSSLSSNVVLAKARAKYGKRLKEKDYRNLLDCKSVAEVVAYLKANTDYHDVLTGINEYDIHRGQLEVLIKQKLFYNLSSFVRYELSVGEQLADYVIARAEIEEILDALMLMSAGRQEEYSQAAPLYLAKHTKIHMEQFSSIQTYGEFLDALGSSVYRRLLAPFEPKPESRWMFSPSKTSFIPICFPMCRKSSTTASGEKQKRKSGSCSRATSIWRITPGSSV